MLVFFLRAFLLPSLPSPPGCPGLAEAERRFFSSLERVFTFFLFLSLLCVEGGGTKNIHAFMVTVE